jgi:hypothetical protein
MLNPTRDTAAALPESALVSLRDQARSPMARARPPLPPPSVVKLVDTVIRTIPAGDSIFAEHISRTTRTADSTDSMPFLAFNPAPPPPPPQLTALNTVVFGIAGYPPDSLGKNNRPYSGAQRLIPCKDLRRAVDQARAVKRTLLPGITRVASKDSTGKLSAQAVGRELACWKQAVPNLQAYADSGYIAGLYLTDEPFCVDPCWPKGGADQYAVDSMGMFSKRLFPRVPTYVRVSPDWFPIQMYAGRKGPRYINVTWYVHQPWKRTSARHQFTQARAAAIARGFAGVVLNFNLLDRGCGPVVLKRCLDGVPGSNIGGTVRDWRERNMFQYAAAEYRVHGKLALELGTCGMYGWTFSPTFPFNATPEQLAWIKAFHQAPEVQAVERELAALALAKPRSSCMSLQTGV